MMALETELAKYHVELPKWLPLHQGKFVLIHDETVGGFFSSYEDAIQVGYEHFGLQPFLVKQIEATETVHFFSRDLKLCPT
jgi:hypothetical protein